MLRSWMMLWWVWLWPSGRFPLPTQLNTLCKKRTRSTAWIRRCLRSTRSFYWILTFLQSSKLTTSWWLRRFRRRYLQAKISPLKNSRSLSAMPDVPNLWNIIKSCTEFANLRGATCPPILAAHRSRGPRKSILWWNLYFASTGKRHRKAQEVCAQSSSRDSTSMWRASRRAEE